MSDDPRLYHELAYLWPIISAPEEYLREAICWHEVLQHKLGPGRHHILELGVGGGLNLFHDCLPLAITDFSNHGLSNRRSSTPKPVFSTKQSKRFESTEMPGKLVAGRLDSTQSPQQLNYFEAKFMETGSVACLMAA